MKEIRLIFPQIKLSVIQNLNFYVALNKFETSSPLNVITLRPGICDHNNRMITITDWFYLVIRNNTQLTTLTLITLGSFHCTCKKKTTSFEIGDKENGLEKRGVNLWPSSKGSIFCRLAFFSLPLSFLNEAWEENLPGHKLNKYLLSSNEGSFELTSKN